LTDHKKKELEMNTKWNFLMALVLLATLVGGSANAAQAQGGITGISPQEGTVGTQVTITGAGFGDKQGEVLLGTEKSKVLAWSDTEITFLVDKPQPPGGYPVTVLHQGDKKPADPLTPAAFTLRRPKINPGELLLDGSTATVVGSFFGDKKGGLRIGYLESGEVAVEDPKILDWSMNTIRFELPAGLTGKFVLAVSNEVGAGLALLDLGEAPLTLDYDPPNPAGFGHLEGNSNSSGVFFKGNFYVFSTDPPCAFSWCNGPIRFRKLTNGVLSAPLAITKGETNVTPVPLVVGDKLWLFHTAADNRILYTVFDGISWDNQWHNTGYKTASDVNEIAAVYNPESHRVAIYYRNGSNQLMMAYSDNDGQSWTGKVVTPTTALTEAPSAAFYKGTLNGAAYDTLVAVNASGKQYVYALLNGAVVGTAYSYTTYTDAKGRPFLVDDLGSEYIYLIVYWNNSSPYNVLKNQVYISKMSKSNNTWNTFYKKITLPPGVKDGSIGFYYFNPYWSPDGAINYELNSTTGLYDRKLYVFYGWAFSSWDFQTVLEPVWTGSYIETPGQGTPSTPLPAPTFTQINGGQYHTCVVRGDNVIDCWGKNSEGQSNKPSGAFMNVSAGTWHTCGVKTNGTIACWGDDDGGRVSGAPTASGFTQVSVGDWHGCGLKSDGSVDCWGDQDGGRTDDKAGPFKQITTGNWHNCAIRNDNSYLYCWGIEDSGRISGAPVNTPFKSISAGDWHTCGVKTDGSLICWGDNDELRVTPVPAGNDFIQVSVGNWHSCALRTNGTIVCWGSNDDNRKSDTPTASGFTQIDAGDRHTCAIQGNNKIVCWGNNGEGQSTPPY
jgi:hypothetical protein